MSISLFDASIPVLARALENLKSVLAKGAEHAEQHKIDPAVLLGSRLYPDMFPLTRQVQIATDMAKGCVARLAQLEAVRFEDTESTFGELAARIDRTLAIIQGVAAAQLQGALEREVTLKLGPRSVTFASGWLYLQRFVLPNVYFHATTAYAILRHNGVKLGKQDFVGAD